MLLSICLCLSVCICLPVCLPDYMSMSAMLTSCCERWLKCSEDIKNQSNQKELNVRFLVERQCRGRPPNHPQPQSKESMWLKVVKREGSIPGKIQKIQLYPREIEDNYGGNRCVLRLGQKDDRVVQERRDDGSEFHTVGAAKEKDRRP